MREKNRRDYFNDIEKYPWAFDSIGKLRGYRDLIHQSSCDMGHKMTILHTEGKLKAVLETFEEKKELYSLLKELRAERNNFVHNPSSKKSLAILSYNSTELFYRLNESRKQLVRSIKER